MIPADVFNDQEEPVTAKGAGKGDLPSRWRPYFGSTGHHEGDSSARTSISKAGTKPVDDAPNNGRYALVTALRQWRTPRFNLRSR